MSNDSRVETYEHIHTVQTLLLSLAAELMLRATEHDQSKLKDPERATFDQFTPMLRTTEYGSDQYKRYLEAMAPALRHHYENNRHHPEHWDAGVDGMTLVDLGEMFCDWLAATKRHAGGDVEKSITHNQERFGLSDQLAQIFRNTWREMSEDLG